MIPPGRLILGSVVAAALTASLGALSRVPVSGADAEQAALRFSWRLRSEEAGECRHPTEEELQDLPTHMRNPDACVGPVPDYHLHVEVGGEARFDSRITASGARGDRPLFVYRELALPPGRHSVTVSFAPENGGENDPRSMRLDTVLELEPGEVLLVTRNEDSGALEVARPRG